MQGLIRSQQRPAVQQGLLRVVAQLAALIADELMVLGDVRQSRAWHGTARIAADQTADDALRANVRVLAALLPLYYGDPADVVTLAREAAAVTEGTPSLATIMGPTFEALGLAQLAATEASLTALHTARAQMQKLEAAYRTESVFGFSVRRWRFYEGKVLSYLGRSEEAWSVLDEALALYPEDVVGDPTLILFDRAISLVRDDQLVAGCELAERTLLDLPAEHRADLFTRAARRVLAAVPADQRTTPPVRQYREAIRACTAVGNRSGDHAPQRSNVD